MHKKHGMDAKIKSNIERSYYTVMKTTFCKIKSHQTKTKSLTNIRKQKNIFSNFVFNRRPSGQFCDQITLNTGDAELHITCDTESHQS